VHDPVALCADAVAGWHETWLEALGLRSERNADVWRALDRPPAIYFAGITLRPRVPAATLADVPGSVCDNWQDLSLEAQGLGVWRTEPWFLRPPGSLCIAQPPELEVIVVSTPAEVEEFEAVSVRGFEDEDATIPPGAIHPPSILGDSRMQMFLGRVDGRPVGAAMGYRTDRAVGVFGVAVVASARRRGYGTALTYAAMLPEIGMPAVLAPSPEGAPLYMKLGFSRVGELSIWSDSSKAGQVL
jgi:ribosomal protein S18 acetylase RimI-like enzyme